MTSMGATEAGPLTVAVLGAGKLGSAMAALLASGGQRVVLWARRPEQVAAVRERAVSVQAATSIEEACRGAALICFAVPTRALREVARVAGEVTRGDQVALHACRGVEPGFVLPHEILRAETCLKKIGALGGPLYLDSAHPDDAARVRPLVAALASRFDEVPRLVKSATSQTRARIHSSRDVIGVEVCGAVSNVAQIAAGFAEGLGLGATDQGLLLTRGLVEATRLGLALGSERATFSGLAGVGDLIPRAVTTMRKHRRLGFEIGRGGDAKAAVVAHSELEGLLTAREARLLGARLGLSVPLIEAVDDVVTSGAAVAEVLERVLSLDLDLDVAA